MRQTLLIISMVFLTLSISAQQPEVPDSIKLDIDANVLAILDRYNDGATPNKGADSWMIEHWHPSLTKFEVGMPGDNRGSWYRSRIVKPVKIDVPKFNDYNSITLRIGTGGGATLSISNGSAYNFMTWPNSPAAYRDARTLSFPVRR